MPASSPLRVQGLRELDRAFKAVGKKEQRDLRKTLRIVVEPVRTEAERLAAGRIRNIGPKWSLMRVGVTAKSVYVVPKQRGVKSRANRKLRRPNLSDLLLGRAMEPALNDNRAEVIAGFNAMLIGIAHEWERL